jgi:putative membrane protein
LPAWLDDACLYWVAGTTLRPVLCFSIKTTASSHSTFRETHFRSTAEKQTGDEIMKKTIGRMLTTLLASAAISSFAQAPAPAAPAPNDAQIAGIVVAANTVDINAGKLAKSKAHNKDVKAFGQRMITDHTGVNKQATALVKKLKVKPEESDTSKSLKEDGTAMVKKLKGLKGAAFDKAYIDNEVTYHQTVLDTIDNTLIPNAKNAELKDLLTKTRPAIDAHLQQAKKVQAELK